MKKWTLKFLDLEAGKATLKSAKAARVDRHSVELYEELLRRAALSQCCRPTFSGFHVRGANATGTAGEVADVMKTGNVEYGYCKALHNEEMAVASLISQRNSADFTGSNVIAIVAGKGKGSLKNFTAPCGNCRDILRGVIGEQCLIVSGNEDGGDAIVLGMDQMLFDAYRKVEAPDRFSQKAQLALTVADESYWVRRNPYFAGESLRDYFVGITVASGVSFYGAARVGADFHPIYPIERALISAEDEYGIADLKEITIVASGDGMKPPDVMYRDRQSLLESVVEHELWSGKSQKLLIRLFTVQKGVVTGAWQTDADEWLPFPFSPRNFGPAFLKRRRAELQKKYGRP